MNVLFRILLNTFLSTVILRMFVSLRLKKKKEPLLGLCKLHSNLDGRSINYFVIPLIFFPVSYIPFHFSNSAIWFFFSFCFVLLFFFFFFCFLFFVIFVSIISPSVTVVINKIHIFLCAVDSLRLDTETRQAESTIKEEM